MSSLKKLLDLLTPTERKRAALLLGMILVMAIFDMLGVASIMPFMAVLANPQLVETNTALNAAFKSASMLGMTSAQSFLFALGFLVFVLLVVSLSFKALTTYAQTRFALMSEFSIGKRLVEGYLRQPYSWFLNRHSADLGKTILSEVNQVIYFAVMPSMNLIAHTTVALALLILLVLIDPVLALTVGLVLGTAYITIFKISSSFMTRSGNASINSNQARFLAVNEAFGAVKEVKVGGLEQVYIQRYAEPAEIYAKQQTAVQVVSQLPRFALEAIAFGGMLLVMLYLLAQGGSFATALPVIALYALAGYRLMPALQHIYGAATQLRFAGAALDALHKDLVSLPPASQNQGQGVISLKQAITLSNIHYSYPNSPVPTLKGITLKIPAKNTIGLVGSTGSGKTTMVDLILGLINAQQGSLEVDGNSINQNNLRAWQGIIGYVPQQIYLADDTISANVALGVDKKYIDQNAVENAAKIANLHDFVVNDLPMGYSTAVGERGVRLSGGQRQRIGIARALYHNPQILILDEATSALDNLTEQAVMEAVHNLGHKLTIILIAHRLSTVKECDTIFMLEKGEIKGQGSFYELTQANERFRAMLSSEKIASN